MNKLCCLIIMFGIATKLLAQDSSLNTVTLKQAKNSEMISLFDTILFQSDKKELIYRFTEIKLNDSVVKLENIISGKFIVTLSSKGMNLSFSDLSVCSKCANEIEYYASVKSGEGPVYTLVTEMPSYYGGDLILAKEFQSFLSKKEKKSLKKIPNFSISFFITKNKEVCDFMFTTNNLTAGEKTIIVNGLLKLKNWRISRQNGILSDDLFTIEKDTLMKSNK